MYEELLARRAVMSATVTNGDSDAMESPKKQQKSVGDMKKSLDD